MKLELLLSCLAAVAVILTPTGLLFNTLALALFGSAVSMLLLLLLASEYSRPVGYAYAYAKVAASRRESMPLAA
jgi:hypothetical protein